jgi:hypothetical protein
MVGAAARVVLLVLHVPNPLWGRLAVFAFLHNFQWFFLFAVTGLLSTHFAGIGTPLDQRLLTWQLRVTAPIAWITFPLGVLGGAATALGSAARIGALALAVGGLLAAWSLRQAGSAGRWLAAWWTVKSVLDVAGVLGLAETAVATRHLAILYLHVVLLGLVSFAVALLVLQALGEAVGRAAWVHHLGLLVMTTGLAVAGGAVFGLAPLAPHLRSGFAGAVLGGGMVLAAAVTWAWRAHPKR